MNIKSTSKFMKMIDGIDQIYFVTVKVILRE